MKKTLALALCVVATVLTMNVSASAATTAKTVKKTVPAKTAVKQVKAVQPAAKAPVKVKIATGTVVPTAFMHVVTSNQVTAGKAIPIVISEDVYVNNVKVFAKGSIGSAKVVEAVPAGRWGRRGILAVSGANILDVYGDTHNLQFNVTEQGLSRRKSSFILTAVTLVPIGIWRKGEPAMVNTTNVYKATTLN